jgi:hypothetical protein
MGSIRHFAGKPPKVIRHAGGLVVLRNRAECQSISLVLTGIGRSRSDGDAGFQLLLSMAPRSFVSLDGDGPTSLGAPMHHRSVALFELKGSCRNYRNSFITTTPTGMHSELHGIVGPEAARAQWPRSTAIIVPSGNRLRIDIFFAFCGFLGHLNDMGWPSINYESYSLGPREFFRKSGRIGRGEQFCTDTVG